MAEHECDALLGVQVGQRTEPSGFCVAEIRNQPGPHGTETHYLVRHLERVPMGASYPALADRSAEVSAALRARGELRPDLYPDATGLGEPVLDLFSRRVGHAHVVAVFFTHGDRRNRISHQELHLGKAYLVARFQTLLLKCRRLFECPQARVLTEGPRDFQIQVSGDANDNYRAVMRAGLTIWAGATEENLGLVTLQEGSWRVRSRPGRGQRGARAEEQQCLRRLRERPPRHP